MSEIKVNELENLIKGRIGQYKKLVDIEIEKLPSAGVGSIMLKIKATLLAKEQYEDLHVVAKILPSSQLTREIFDVQNTFKAEIAFYATILPLLNKFRKDNGIGPLECFAEFYGARINLNSSDIVDEDCAIVLDNLLEKGYRNGDRLEGLDFETAKIVVKDLADFHGTTIALKTKHPEDYNEKVVPLCFDLKSGIKKRGQGKILNYYGKIIRLIIAENENCKHLQDLAPSEFGSKKGEGEGIFAGIAHYDLWVNNTMQKTVDGKIVGNKLVDWQCYSNKSCLNDLIFFLFTSVKISILQENLEYFLRYYHENLKNTIQSLRCDIEKFTYENFLEEIRYELGVRKEYQHVLMFILIVKRDDTKSEKLFDELHKRGFEKPEDDVKKLSLAHKETFWYFITEGDKRGWFKNN